MISVIELMWAARRQSEGGPKPTIEEMRAGMEETMAGLPTIAGVTNQPAEAAGVPAEWTTPDGAELVGTLLYAPASQEA